MDIGSIVIMFMLCGLGDKIFLGVNEIVVDVVGSRGLFKVNLVLVDEFKKFLI